ncbi:MAG TPA: glycosyltransferase family 39 protein [Anaerolineales bacterium]|nr:glycosyltransferase family 39 protein [Anaerolineales bacterium]
MSALPWRSLLALALGILAQSILEPPGFPMGVAIGLYGVAVGFLIWSAWRGEWQLAELAHEAGGSDPFVYRRTAFLIAIPLALLAFLAFTDNLFTGFNVTLWMAALVLIINSLWLPDGNGPSLWRRVTSALRRPSWEIRFDRWALLVLAAVALVTFFRLYHLQQTPAEPFSDHAEKLLDVYDVSQGQTHIFFPRNTGREAIQMYWTLLISWIFGTGLSFISLKLGTALIGLLTLPYMYMLGKEVGGPRVGLLALVLTGIAYWPNVISRIGLRFPLYPMFVAPLMLYLLRGFRRRHRNDFVLAGVFLGLGLHGYSPFRIVPLLVLAAFALYAMHPQSRGARRSAALWLAIVGIVSLVIFLPLLRYAAQHADSFNYRALSRLAGVEQPLAAPWYQVFLSNTWNALTLFNWNNGGIWVHSIPNRPAMDVVTGMLFLFGVVLLLARYVRGPNWQDLFLLVSIPILLLPSILSLAFPDENPSLNRTAGALVPAFVIAALALDGMVRSFARRNRTEWMGIVLAVILLWSSAQQNYDLVFRQFDKNFRENAWNSSEMGAVIKQFGLVYGQTNTAWVIPFPYWVDTRLVGVWAGIPNRDFAMWTEQLPETLQYAGPKLFMARANTELPELNDQKAIDALRQLYPQGSLSLHRSPVPGHDFWIYFVPALTAP